MRYQTIVIATIVTLATVTTGVFANTDPAAPAANPAPAEGTSTATVAAPSAPAVAPAPVVVAAPAVAAEGSANPAPSLRSEPGSTEVSLEQQLENLSVPTNRAPTGVSSERLYSVQSRYMPLRHRSEVTLAGGKNFSADGFLVSNNIDLGYRFYLSDKWYLSANGGYVFNSLSSGGQRLLDSQGMLPDVPFVKYRADLMAGYHLFYGKFRLSMDQVFYFDQYVALGAGYVDLNTVGSMAAVADVGIVFWFGKSLTARFGLKDYLYNERRTFSQGLAHSLLGHLDLGYVFGG